MSAVPRMMPRAHIPMYAVARHRMRSVWSDIDEIHVIGASSMHGSLATSSIPSLVWLATLIGDERLSSLHLQSRSRRTLYRATLGQLARIEAKVLSRASRILAMSPHTADLIVREGLVPASRIEIRTVPIDTDLFTPPDRASARIQILFVGRANDPRKGFARIRTLLESSSQARDTGIEVVSRIAPILDDGMHWVGSVDSLPQIYGRARILAMPSIQEGLGIVAFESLACGTPVVAYRCGGPDRFLTESGGAILVDDDRTFRAAVEYLLADEGARAEMGIAGRRYVVENFSSQNFLENASLFSLIS
jgi:glycosyltransferase involved in cell wall biosynthesis